jgi:dihydroneopterin aldolase
LSSTPHSPVLLSGLNVFVRALRLDTEIGLYPHERGRAQPLFIDIELELSPHHVGGIGDTVNYETLAAKARALAAEGHVELVETFAERLVAACLEDPRALTARVRIEKPEALPGAAAAGVEIVARRG